VKLRIVVSSAFLFVVAFALAALPFPAPERAARSARGAQKPAAQYAVHSRERILRPGSLAWRPETSLAPGAESVVLEGDPAKPGLVILRLKMPDGYRIPPVWHPAADRFTVLSGTYHMGVGARFDETKAVALRPGDFAWLSPAAPHYGWASGETVLEIVGLGPFVTNYVNPKQDPRRK
jgi:mannose-6-phosphate isomerase-like protein (cupin superfamily)